MSDDDWGSGTPKNNKAPTAPPLSAPTITVTPADASSSSSAASASSSSSSSSSSSGGLLSSLGSYAYSRASLIYEQTSDLVKNYSPSVVRRSISRAEGAISPLVSGAAQNYALPLLQWVDQKVVPTKLHTYAIAPSSIASAAHAAEVYSKLRSTNAAFRDIVSDSSPLTKKLNAILPSTTAVDSFSYEMTLAYEKTRATHGAAQLLTANSTTRITAAQIKKAKNEQVNAFLDEIKEKMGAAWDPRLLNPARSFFNAVYASEQYQLRLARIEARQRLFLETASMTELLRAKAGHQWEQAILSVCGAQEKLRDSMDGLYKSVVTLYHNKLLQQQQEQNGADDDDDDDNSKAKKAAKAVRFTDCVSELKQKMGHSWDDRLTEPALAVWTHLQAQQELEEGDDLETLRARFVATNSLYAVARQKLGVEWERSVTTVYGTYSAAKDKIMQVTGVGGTATTTSTSSSTTSPSEASSPSENAGVVHSAADLFYRRAVESYERLAAISKDRTVAAGDFVHSLKSTVGTWSSDLSAPAQQLFAALSASSPAVASNSPSPTPPASPGLSSVAASVVGSAAPLPPPGPPLASYAPSAPAMDEAAKGVAEGKQRELADVLAQQLKARRRAIQD